MVRFQGSEVKVCYQFVLVAKEDLPLDAEGRGLTLRGKSGRSRKCKNGTVGNG